MTANYYGMISLVDHNVGRLLAALADSGDLENTFVFFTSDHGDFLGDHGLYLKGPMLYESLINVGLIAAGPECRKAIESTMSCPVLTLPQPLRKFPALLLRVHGTGIRFLTKTPTRGRHRHTVSGAWVNPDAGFHCG